MANLRGMQVEACMIDLDGTMVDTMGDFDAVVALMLKDLGLPALERIHLEGMVGFKVLAPMTPVIPSWSITSDKIPDASPKLRKPSNKPGAGRGTLIF